MFPPGFLDAVRMSEGFHEESFTQAHRAAAPPVTIRLNPGKFSQPAALSWAVTERVPWCDTGFYLPERPVFTLDPLLHAGAYYVQEASSMFVEQAVKMACSMQPVKRALDLCAAPGGKSTHLLSLLPADSLVVSNEVIQARSAVLLENIIKWGPANSMVTRNDPADFGRLGPAFDLLLVDAPCSGSGLFRRDAGAMAEWSPQAVELCSQRQQRILADVLPSLNEGGFLLYATCSYSPEEDERIIDWLADNFPLEGIAVDWPANGHGVVCCNSPLKRLPCYRFYPGRVKGEGFFMALMRATGPLGGGAPFKQKDKPVAPAKLPAGLAEWVNSSRELHYYQHAETGYLMPEQVWKAFQLWQGRLNIRKAGVKIAEHAHGRYNPVHDFALSTLISQKVFEMYDAPLAEALAFLRKQDFQLPAAAGKGWVLLQYQEMPLGWMKNLGNRVNNYYPKEWRIRMQP